MNDIVEHKDGNPHNNDPSNITIINVLERLESAAKVKEPKSWLFGYAAAEIRRLQEQVAFLADKAGDLALQLGHANAEIKYLDGLRKEMAWEEDR